MKWKGPSPILDVITDEKWTKLKCLSGLPDEARIDVDGAISFYRKYRLYETGPAPAKARGQLQAFHKRTSEFLNMIKELRQAEHLFAAFSGSLSGVDEQKTKRADKELSKLQDQVSTLENRLDQASGNVNKGKRGPQRETLEFVLKMLNMTLIQRTGRPISRAKVNRAGYSPGEFAIKVMQIADDTLDRPTISNKIKSIVSEMQYWDDEYKPWLRAAKEKVAEPEIQTNDSRPGTAVAKKNKK